MQPSPQTGRGLRWLLYASLALNLLIIGLIVGVVVAGGGRHGPGLRAVIDSPVPLLRALDPPAREEMRARLRADRPAPAQRPVTALRITRDMLEILRTEPYDAAAFETLVSRQADAFAARNAAGRVALLEVIAAMGPEERRAYADRVEEALRKGRERPPRPGSGG